MKSFALAFLVIIAGASALPQYNEAETKEERLVAGAIIAAIDQASQGIKDAGLDPVNIDSAEWEYVFVPMIMEASAAVDRLIFHGLSNIAVNNMDFSILFNRLRFDISLPELSLSVGNSAARVVVFGATGGASLNGALSVRQIRIVGEVRINIGIISGISVTSLSLNLSLGGIQSAVNVNILGRDVSNTVNKVLNDTIPNFLAANQNQINDLLEKIVWEVIDRVL